MSMTTTWGFSVFGQNYFIPFFGKFILVQAKQAEIVIYAKDFIHGLLLSAKREDRENQRKCLKRQKFKKLSHDF
jgi:hypothetical protein